MWWLFIITLIHQINASFQPPIRNYDFIQNLNLLHYTKDLLSLNFMAYNITFQLLLESHKDFHIPGAIVSVQSSNGNYEFPLDNRNVYKGSVIMNGEKLSNSWTRIVIQDPLTLKLEGVISTPKGVFHLKQIDQYRRSKRINDVEIASPFSRSMNAIRSNLILLQDGDEETMLTSAHDDEELSHLTKRENFVSSCGTPDPSDSELDYISKFLKPPSSNFISKAQSKAGVNRAATGCPTIKKLLMMGVAADCSYVKEKGGTQNTLSAILSNWAAASAIYEANFNVQLGVTTLMIQETCSPDAPNMKWNSDCSNPDYTISDRLSDFSRWRGQKDKDSVGLWHLMTKCSTTPAVGIAWLGTLCQTTSQSQFQDGKNVFVSGAGVSSIVPSEYKVVAHEIGHNFGAIHDCTRGCSGASTNCSPCEGTCDCKSQFLMNPLDTSVTDNFSPGSLSLICPTIMTKGSCLIDPSQAKLVKEGICGNGVKERGEDCDCGLPEACGNDRCCDGKTCKFKAGAVCDTLNDNCCDEQCQLKPNTAVCHSPVGVCDTKAFCTGTNATCPTDTFIPNGSKCSLLNGGTAQCASGLCTTRDLQCTGTGNAITTVSACPAFAMGCALNCQDKNGVCYALNGNFVDGTPCSGDGKCVNGKCEGWTLINLVKLYLDLYPYYAWPALIITSLIALSIIWSCIRPCIFRNKYKQPVIPARPSSYRPTAPQNNQETYNYPTQEANGTWDPNANQVQYPGQAFPAPSSQVQPNMQNNVYVQQSR